MWQKIFFIWPRQIFEILHDMSAFKHERLDIEIQICQVPVKRQKTCEPWLTFLQGQKLLLRLGLVFPTSPKTSGPPSWKKSPQAGTLHGCVESTCIIQKGLQSKCLLCSWFIKSV